MGLCTQCKGVRQVNYRKLVRNTATAFFAQGIAMALSIVQTLLIPRLLGVEQYGYWQLFIFYASYVGFFHLGLNDGVYLIKGGQDRATINKRSVNSQFLISVSFQFLIAVLICVIAITGGFNDGREFVLVCTGVFLVIQNAASFLSFLLQAMNETRRSSYSTIVERLSFLVPLTVLLMTRTNSFRPYVISYIFSSVVQLCFCLWLCRDFIFSGLDDLPMALRESALSVRIGIKLMLANIASQLILGIARAAIDAAWGITTFGRLSFALSMVNFFLAFVSQASMVLFPALRQSKLSEIRRFYQYARDVMGLFFPIIYLLYFPMVWLLGLWLPEYSDSLVFFAFLLPICIFDSKMNITCTTFFKVRRQEGLLLLINVVTSVASAIGTCIGIYVVGSIYFVICVVVICIVGRSLWSERYIGRSLEVPTNKISLGELVATLVFVVVALNLPLSVACVSYCFAYTVFLLFFRDEIRMIGVKVRSIIR